ncbi:MAG: hypothetical protein ACI35S_01690 [Anaeroplasma sp.]
MKKKKLIILGGILSLSLFICIVFGAFIFKRIVDGNVSTGTINLSEKYFLDYSIEDSEERAPEGSLINAKETNSITCYATKKKGYKDEEDYFYLNQLGFKFSFTNTIDVYVRIHIQDSWISRKVYNNGNVIENYITKDKVEGKSPFDITDEYWIYDEETNCAYLKTKVSADSENNSFTFNINEDYWYESSINTNAYREQILVQISFIVDIVQANRAAKKWDVNLSDLLGGN